ncbi:hypothetical protein K450DRAFT_247034 [Umbelopsis ramanniana AG]|uniref:sphingolipid C(9)-methyltransferase n=1 Tax=Umbelopsis ramanniana AG TaxID=1314678 RepID=A0AAD5HDT1_UMBRA|nr:uncharacterized protein K450DRAFT_247034 [Umbelopsis ramanniana AG]KAI8578478.1 hypothetical protein K450DRAFT_247034 [Umbelopsis ramanniana AG]
MTVAKPWTPSAWAAIHNAPLPAEGAGNQTFDNRIFFGLLGGVPLIVTVLLRWSLWLYPVVAIVLALPILAGSLYLASSYSPRYKNRVALPERPLEDYITIKDPELKSLYNGRNLIPMETFFEAYFDGKIDFKGDALDIMEARHDWAAFRFTMGQFKFFLTQWIPETLWHSRKQDEDQVREHYDRGDDFYEAFLGPRMVYTSGIISDPTKRETLEELQDNKLNLICEKIHLKPGDNNNRIKEWGVDPKQARIKCMDYRDIPSNVKYNKITCVEMAEHVGLLHFQKFLLEIREMLDDDGLFYMQVAGLRATWQYEDFIWGLFMARYIFPGADASTPLYWYINQLECAGFEIHNIDTVGVHYSATLERWYYNWMENKEKITSKYGNKWFRVWEIFLSWSTIISRQGSATCFQIVANKNMNSVDRAALICNRTNPKAWTAKRG